MTDNTVNEKVLEIIRKTTENASAELDQDFVNDLGLSSLEVMSIVSSIGRIFNVKILSRELRQIETGEDLAEIVAQKIQ